MRMMGAVVLHAAIVCIWALSGEASTTIEPEKTTAAAALQTSTNDTLISSVNTIFSELLKDSPSQLSSSVMPIALTLDASMDSTETSVTHQTPITSTLTKPESEDMTPTSVTPSILFTSQSNVQTTTSQLSPYLTQTEQGTSTPTDTTISYSTNSSVLPTGELLLSSRTDSFSTTLLSSTAIHTEFTSQQNHHETERLSGTTEVNSLSTLSESPLPIAFTASMSRSAGPGDSKTASQSSQAQPTSMVHSQTPSFTKSETGITSSSTSTMIVTYTPEAPTQKPSPSETSKDKVKGDSTADLTPGTKIAVGVVVAVCLLGVVVAGVVVYRRYNITHRSLKSFLTSGVRYKTYNNAIYKDDEVVGEVGIVSELT